MKHKQIIVLCTVCFYYLFGTYTFGQAAIPPDSIKISIVESIGDGCGQITNHADGIICFDILLEIDQPNWFLRSYNIWMDYGANNSVLNHASDLSCGHIDGGDINLDQFGKYRFSAANDTVPMIANEPVVIQNFCINIIDSIGLKSQSVIPGGTHFQLNSSIYLCDSNHNSYCINPLVLRCDTFKMSESSFFKIKPVAEAVCDYPNLYLSAYPEGVSGGATINCEPFQVEWTGPNGFVSYTADTAITIIDPVSQSGLYELHVMGANGCAGYESVFIDTEACSLAAIPPDLATVSIVESTGGCHRSSNHLDGQICFDVMLKVNQSDWALKAYDVWMDYGTNNSVLTYAFDSACIAGAEILGDLNLDQFGKYRFISRNTYNEGFLYLPENQEVNFHNFCLDINSFADLANHTVTPGGDHFNLFSHIQLVDQFDTLNSIIVSPTSGEPYILNTCSFLNIDPNASADCNTSFLKLSTLAEDATGTSIIDCEAFHYLWTGPDSFMSIDSVNVIPIIDPESQSGIYELFVIGENGCQGHTSFSIDLVNCEVVQCDDYIYLDGPLNLTSSRQARIEIISQGNVEISDDIILGAPAISLMPFFEVPLGVDFQTSSVGCP